MISPITYEALMYTVGYRLPLAALMLANMVPIYGVLWGGWDAGLLIVLYWAENLIVGLYSVLKILLAGVRSPLGILANLFVVAFFCIHYGGFVAVHGMFVFEFIQPGGKGVDMQNLSWPMHLVFLELLWRVVQHLFAQMTPIMLTGLSLLLVSHGVSFTLNYLLRGEYRRTTARTQMVMPYGRIVIMHITLLAGAFFVMQTGSPTALVVVLVLLKIGLDMAFHVRTHKKLGTDYRLARSGGPALEVSE